MTVRVVTRPTIDAITRPTDSARFIDRHRADSSRGASFAVLSGLKMC
jgi:hypothetical protein